MTTAERPRFWWLDRRLTILPLSKLWKIEALSESDETNLETARKHLLKDGSLAVLPNHSFAGDNVCAGRFLIQSLGPWLGEVVVPAAADHYFMERDPKYATMLRVIKFLARLEMIPIEQAGRGKFDRRAWAKLKEESVQILKKPQGVVLHYLEGHRPEVPGLKRAETGIIHILEAAEEGAGRKPICLPLAVYLLEKGGRELNLWAKVKVRFGRPFFLADLRKKIEAKKIVGLSNPVRRRLEADLIMLRIAELLPVDLRGFYRDFDPFEKASKLPVRPT